MLNEETQSLRIWKGFHWSFFVMTQGLTICLKRFEEAIKQNDLILAQKELKTATNLMLASSAAMKLTGSFNPSHYQNYIRSTMNPPGVKSPDFSGLMSWDHAILIELWKQLKPIFSSIPLEIKPNHDEFIIAYKNLAESHRKVCSKFGGEEMGSLVCPNKTAVETLDKFANNRQRLLKGNKAKFSC
ncbi:siderophore biosynthesis protein [Aphanothece sacrum]|uniref:Catechol hydroxylase n=1 Tax=Aphanothece sacrum FPU1 TaxID=1920663 RepID=A0A401IHU5_APHSA|nr:siderophore biosynthesis protein [Aphanothece sacrum]GBF80863.1 catechol hydroxylase [Aphanothece sacrum FPU1]GBF85171.1 catechol hydroxylase [Aphanothece sacrum FPU3]